MSENCTHNCGTCGQNCGSRKELTMMEGSSIKHIIGVTSGKGGVGKSTVSALLAKELQLRGYKVGIMDADITGPSIPKMFGLKKELFGDEYGIYPAKTESGIEVVSINMMLENEDVPVLWRGPILGGVINQFYSEVYWGELDYMVIDMPPGTGDVPIQIVQTIPVDGFVMVTSPSQLVGMIVGKTINMAKQVDKKVYALVDNMAYVKCPDCGREIHIYKNDNSEKMAEKYGLDLTSKLPMDPTLADLADNGNMDSYTGDYLKGTVDKIIHG
ncbi:MAG: Mrp/NBP35 family ATP-binding protein [Erysipelotrichaceae bacterium]|nr:Mrp/NBP35 family ATP-binding protein [Erysipelotrichaceae bacterium]